LEYLDHHHHHHHQQQHSPWDIWIRMRLFLSDMFELYQQNVEQLSQTTLHMLSATQGK
jgi:hypothetical protein